MKNLTKILQKEIFPISLILLLAFSRLMPHPPNFTPIIAMGLFGGAYIHSRSLAVLIPICSIFLSDLFLGFHETAYFVYGSLLLVTILGMILIKKITIKNCTVAALSSSLLFFLITNFGVWLIGPYYPKNIQGILACYTMALPFLGNTLLGTLFYSSVMFGGYELLKRNMAQSAPESLLK